MVCCPAMRSQKTILSLLAIAFLVALTGTDSLAQVNISRPDTANGPTEVQMQLVVIDISEVKVASQSVVADLFYVASWHDPRLAHESPGKMIYPLEEVWQPRF